MNGSKRKGRRVLGELDTNVATPVSVKKVERALFEVILLPGPMGIEFESAEEEEIGCRVVRLHEIESEEQSVARERVAPGDVIARVDDDDVDGWAFARIVDALRRRKDQRRRLTFHRRGPLDDAIQAVSKLRQSARDERKRGGASRSAVSESALSSTRAALRSIKKAMSVSCDSSESDGFWSAASSPVVVKQKVDRESLTKASHARVVAATARESKALKTETEHTRAVLGRVANVLESSSDAATAEIEAKVRNATRHLREALEASELARERLKADFEVRESQREAVERQQLVEFRAAEKEKLDKMREQAAVGLRDALAGRDAAHRAEITAMREELESDAARRAAAELRAESARARLRHEDELRDADARFDRKLRRALRDQRAEILSEERRERTIARDEIQAAERRLVETKRELAMARQAENDALDELRASTAAAHALSTLYEDANADLILDDEDFEARMREAETRYAELAQELERSRALVSDCRSETLRYRNEVEDLRSRVETRDCEIRDMRENAARLDALRDKSVEEARQLASADVDRIRAQCEARVARARDEASRNAEEHVRRARSDAELVHRQQQEKLSTQLSEALRERDQAVAASKAITEELAVIRAAEKQPVAEEEQRQKNECVQHLERLVRERDEWIKNQHPREVDAARRDGERRVTTECKLAFRAETQLREARHAAEIAKIEKELEEARKQLVSSRSDEEEAAVDECLSEETNGQSRRDLETAIAVRDARIEELNKLLVSSESSFGARDRNLRGLVTKYADETGQLRRRLDAANLAASQVRRQLDAARASSCLKARGGSPDELSYSSDEDDFDARSELKRRDAQLAALALSLDAVTAERDRISLERDRAKFASVASSAAAKAALMKRTSEEEKKASAAARKKTRHRRVATTTIDAVAAVARRLQSSENAATKLRTRLESAARLAAREALQTSDERARRDAEKVCTEIEALRVAIDASVLESSTVRSMVRNRIDDRDAKLEELVNFNRTIHAYIAELAAE